jgi:TPR repeat protein
MMQKLCSFLSISFAIFLAMVAVGSQALAEDARFLHGQIAANDGNYAAAVEVWLPLACEGHVKAPYGVGSLHAEGQGTPLGMTEALVWWRLAAEQGDDRAQFNITAMYKAGLGAERDDVLAFSWMERAAERDNRSAQARLSKFYAEGSGVERDPKSAFIWFEIARLAGRTIGASNRVGLLAQLNGQYREDAIRRAAAWRAKSD